jgi:hypothetical protein
MTHCGMPSILSEILMVPRAGVQDPQRPFWLDTQRMLCGQGFPEMYLPDNMAARCISESSLRTVRFPTSASDFASRRATILATHSRSWAAVK